MTVVTVVILDLFIGHFVAPCLTASAPYLGDLTRDLNLEQNFCLLILTQFVHSRRKIFSCFIYA